MQWFENQYDRANVAEFVLRTGLKNGKAQEYHPGFLRTTCAAPSYGGVALLHYYPYRKVYDPELAMDVPIAYSYYWAQLHFRSLTGAVVTSCVEFNDQQSIIKRNSEYALPSSLQSRPDEITAQTIAVLDEALIQRAQVLGIQSMPALLPRSDYRQTIGSQFFDGDRSNVVVDSVVRSVAPAS